MYNNKFYTLCVYAPIQLEIPSFHCLPIRIKFGNKQCKQLVPEKRIINYSGGHNKKLDII